MEKDEMSTMPMVDGCDPFHCANPECKKGIRESDRTLVWLKVWVKQKGRWEAGAFCRECGAPPSKAVLAFIEHHYIREAGNVQPPAPEDFTKGEYTEMDAEQKALAASVLLTDEQLEKLEKCRSCKAPVIWLRNNATSKLAPIDAQPSEKGNIEIDREEGIYRVLNFSQREGRADLHTNHFVTCPQAKAWGKKK